MGEDINNFLRNAAQKGDLESLVYYVRQGADVNSTDRNAATALHFASFEGHSLLVKRLIKAGAWVDATNRNGQASLHLAASKGHGRVVASLLKAKCDPQLKTKYSGMTALHLAVQNTHTDVVVILLSHDRIDTNILDKFGRKAEDIATVEQIKRVFAAYDDKQREKNWVTPEQRKEKITCHDAKSGSMVENKLRVKEKKFSERTKLRSRSEAGVHSSSADEQVHDGIVDRQLHGSSADEQVHDGIVDRQLHSSSADEQVHDGIVDRQLHSSSVNRPLHDGIADGANDDNHQHMSHATLEQRYRENTTVNELTNKINLKHVHLRERETGKDDFEKSEAKLNYEKHKKQAKVDLRAVVLNGTGFRDARINYSMEYSQEHLQRMQMDVFKRLSQRYPKYSHNMK